MPVDQPLAVGALRALDRVASGGELSRVLLALISAFQRDSGRLLVFDEIDAGVSGEVARKIGNLLEKLSSKHQIICITHTPQIASCKATHLHVYKDNSGDRTFTQITVSSSVYGKC